MHWGHVHDDKDDKVGMLILGIERNNKYLSVSVVNILALGLQAALV